MLHRLGVILFLGSLVACAESPKPESQPDDFGLAVRRNMEAQIIADEGEVRTLAPAPGDRRALAVGRYQTDQVEQPAEVYTRAE